MSELKKEKQQKEEKLIMWRLIDCATPPHRVKEQGGATLRVKKADAWFPCVGMNSWPLPGRSAVPNLGRAATPEHVTNGNVTQQQTPLTISPPSICVICCG